MANVDKPYKRLGENAWEDLLNQVNEELENPPDGCDPIDPIENPEECHLWAKKDDIQNVHDKLDEMPGDCFTFEDIPDLWKISIIEDIEDQLGESWCDCTGGCLYPCEQVGELTITFLLTVNLGETDCTTCSNTPQQTQDASATWSGPHADLIEVYDEEWDKYGVAGVEACDLQNEVDALQEEVDKLQEQKDEACADPDQESRCQSLTQRLEEKEEELEEKEEELADKEEERDDAKSTCIGAGQAANGLAESNCCSCCGGQTFIGLVLGAGLNFPPTNTSCDDEGVGDPCQKEVDEGSLFLNRSFRRCTAGWTFQTKTSGTLGSCHPSGGGSDYETDWRSRMSGDFDPDGAPVMLSFGGTCMGTVVDAVCFSLTCGGICLSCQGFDPCPCPPGTEQETSYRVVSRYLFGFPSSPISCDGSPCEEGGGEE